MYLNLKVGPGTPVTGAQRLHQVLVKVCLSNGKLVSAIVMYFFGGGPWMRGVEGTVNPAGEAIVFPGRLYYRDRRASILGVPGVPLDALFSPNFPQVALLCTHYIIFKVTLQ